MSRTRETGTEKLPVADGRRIALRTRENQRRDLSRRRDSLLLSRSRVVNDLSSARNEHYREVLRRSLEHLDHEIGRIDLELERVESSEATAPDAR